MEAIVSFLIFFVFLISNNYAKEIKAENYVRYLNEVVEIFSNEIQREHGLVCIGSGGIMPNDIEMIQIRLISAEIATIDKARSLLVQSTKKLFQMINKNEKIRPFLREHPFNLKRIQVSISFRNKEANNYIGANVLYASKINDFFNYYLENSSGEKGEEINEEVREETFINQQTLSKKNKILYNSEK